MRPVRVDSAENMKYGKRLIAVPISVRKKRRSHFSLNSNYLFTSNDAGDTHLRLVSNRNSIYVL